MEVNMIPRNEHPNPQFMRENYVNLNGEWDFAFDFGNSGNARGMNEGKGFDRKIIVPFCPESKLSGIGYTDFMNAVWYKRSFTLTAAELNGRVVLHFGAADYETFVWVNGKNAGSHVGGYTSFAFDITALVHEGDNEIIVNCQDFTAHGRHGGQPVGKQSIRYASAGCCYTRTTGIWQTVYLEFTPKAYIDSFKYYPDVENSLLTVTGKVCGSGRLELIAEYEGKRVGEAARMVSGNFSLELALDELHLWEVGHGRLYDLTLKFGSDEVKSYFGMRNISLGKRKFLINGKSVFERLVLDQGFYPDGIYTARDDAELERDILLSLELGFNGARLHEKVFEPRFLYHCDRHGYIVWGEYPNWGLWDQNPELLAIVIPEWIEEITRDFNHPSIVGWCPLNETGAQRGAQDPRNISELYKITKALDPTRLCIDTSGFAHVLTDIYDLHDYDQNPESLKESYAHMRDTEPYIRNFQDRYQKWHDEPVFVSEYGGIGYAPEFCGSAWSYGNATKTENEFLERYKGLTDVLLDNPDIHGFCYTQLYDVEQEQNGLYTYERNPKFDTKALFEINSRKAAIED